MTVKTDQEKRKARSEKILKKEGVPFIDHLPVIDSEEETELRSKEEVCERAICLALVAACAEGLDRETLDRKILEYGVRDRLSPEEKVFVKKKKFNDADKAKFIWRYEALWVLLWSLGYVGRLEKPTGICDVPRAVGTITERGRERFIAEAKLRSKSEILDEADLIYRYHWATTEARLNEEDMPSGLDNDTIYERHYALNWLINYMDQPWDEISTDT